ncbi:hypothetical protein [Sodalis sp.]|uniref:hypothetical protein n=1 Tax=Sodalis sp. (in: enterobacteria) TaxID=1898979 RepID=UPI003872FEFF
MVGRVALFRCVAQHRPATAWSKRTSVSYPDKGEASEDLLCLPALARINGKRAFILRGNRGRDVLKDATPSRRASYLLRMLSLQPDTL